MHYLFLGDDEQSKNARISAVRAKIFSSEDARKFDCDILYAGRLSADDLKKSLIALPALSRQRLVIIRSGEKLSKKQKELLLEFCASDQQKTVVILELVSSGRDGFVKSFRKFAKAEEFVHQERENVFALTRMMSARRHADALKVLHALIGAGQHPLQIMGGIVWFWGHKARARVSRDGFEKGLLYLKEADLNIKRSKLSANTAMEVLVAKLCLLYN